MLKPLAFLALSLAAISAFAATGPAPPAPTAPSATDPVKSLLDLDQQLAASRTEKRKNAQLADFREELPVSVEGQKSAELEKLPLGPSEEE